MPDGSKNIIGVLETLQSAVVPAHIPPFHLVSAWEGNPGETLELTFDVLSPTKKTLIPPAKQSFAFREPIIYVVIVIEGLSLNEPGVNRIRFIYEGRIHSIPLYSKFIEQ